jgi:hypothetical protein
MKKATFLLALLISFLSMRSLAQSSAGSAPVVTLGTIEASKVQDGKMVPTFTTTERIIRGAKFVANPAGIVTSYSFSIAANGNTFGPIEVNGAALSEQVVNKIKETKTVGVKVYFDNIHVSYNGKDVVANPVILRYDQ